MLSQFYILHCILKKLSDILVIQLEYLKQILSSRPQLHKDVWKHELLMFTREEGRGAGLGDVLNASTAIVLFV